MSDWREQELKAIDECARRLGVAALQPNYEELLDYYRQFSYGQLFRDIAFACGALGKEYRASKPLSSQPQKGE